MMRVIYARHAGLYFISFRHRYEMISFRAFSATARRDEDDFRAQLTIRHCNAFFLMAHYDDYG